MSDDFHYNVISNNITYFSFCQHHAEAPQTETCQAPHLNTSHNNLHDLYCNMQSIRIQMKHPALCMSQELLLSCYILNFYDLQSAITIHSGSLLHPRFLSHPFASRQRTNSKCSYSTTSLICLHTMNSNSVTLHLLAR